MIPVPSGAVAHHNFTGAVAAFHVVVQRATFAQLHADHLTLGLLGGFADGLGDFFRFTFAKANAAFLVANNDEGGEAKALTTFYGFGDAVDRDQAVGEFRCFVADRGVRPTVFSLWPCRPPFMRRARTFDLNPGEPQDAPGSSGRPNAAPASLDFQAAFTGASATPSPCRGKRKPPRSK